VNRLKQLGASFVPQTNASPVCRFAVVGDPDANEIIIHKPSAPSILISMVRCSHAALSA
jgi:hypothetical protein